MKKKNLKINWLFSLKRYVIFFLMMDFVITCCILLFLKLMSQTAGIVLDRVHVELAAKLTFVNIVLLSLICTVIDGIRRRFLVDRPVRQIIEAADQIMKGNFSVRIPPLHSADSMDGFDVIADYFNRMAEELSGIESLRTDFISNVSHELKTPLSVIQNYGTMLQQPELPEGKRMEYAKTVTDASLRLADLITNILKLNKLENQQIYPSVKEYDLGEQLCGCMLSFEHVWEKKELEIDTDLEENLMIDADEELLSLVWNNLFSNAVKFTEPHGKVTLSLKPEGPYAVVSIADTGCGISPEVGKHIFEKFYQGDTSHAVQGNGLGLALVKRVIDIVGGEISVSSEVGKGSVFTVKLRRKCETD
ncbi:MAG TPA: HAMP domain-containing histidine kinase [Candidatus Eisenbergiella merdipullorum]|uniref:histidine kinase n=1 Tax=Candidatus Eisenbergiella merdipullorum TaxID=2838553 RepID=A0A9D2I875_9FIRM|nr:HAMP domain-containing histidine kinase [Candidatus Eisenbergiella merdipullorum]